jgi:hypothetical protein
LASAILRRRLPETAMQLVNPNAFLKVNYPLG